MLSLTKCSDFCYHLENMFIDFSQKIINTLRVDFRCWPVGEEDILQGLETVVIDNYVFDFKERNQILSHPARKPVPVLNTRYILNLTNLRFKYLLNSPMNLWISCCHSMKASNNSPSLPNDCLSPLAMLLIWVRRSLKKGRMTCSICMVKLFCLSSYTSLHLTRAFWYSLSVKTGNIYTKIKSLR